MKLLSVTDPRDNLERARRAELLAYAQANGVKEIIEDMPAILMRKILRQRNLINIPVPQRQLGAYTGKSSYGGDALVSDDTSEVATSSVMAEDDLERQWRSNGQEPAAAVAPAKTDFRSMHMGQIRKAVKAAGITADRKCKRDDLIRMLEEHHGQDAA